MPSLSKRTGVITSLNSFKKPGRNILQQKVSFMNINPDKSLNHERKNPCISICLVFFFFIFSIIFSYLPQFARADIKANIEIDYVTGICQVDIAGDGHWVDAKPEMKLTDAAVVKTEPHSYMEVSLCGEHILITENKVVSLKDIRQKLEEKKKLLWLKKVGSILAVLSGKNKKAQTSILGVRSRKQEEEELDWMGEEGASNDLYERAKEYYYDGDYSEAIPLFYQLVESGGEEALSPEVSFYMGSSLFNNLQYEESLKYLSKCLEDKDTEYYEPALFDYSFASYFLHRYDVAASNFERYMNEFPESEFTPYVVFMAGKSYKKMGEEDKAFAYFKKVVDSYPESEVYHDSLNELKAD